MSPNSSPHLASLRFRCALGRGKITHCSSAPSSGRLTAAPHLPFSPCMCVCMRALCVRARAFFRSAALTSPVSVRLGGGKSAVSMLSSPLPEPGAPDACTTYHGSPCPIISPLSCRGCLRVACVSVCVCVFPLSRKTLPIPTDYSDACEAV